jgi:hypothetical protein
MKQFKQERFLQAGFSKDGYYIPNSELEKAVEKFSTPVPIKKGYLHDTPAIGTINKAEFNPETQSIEVSGEVAYDVLEPFSIAVGYKTVLLPEGYIENETSYIAQTEIEIVMGGLFFDTQEGHPDFAQVIDSD